MYKLLKKCIRSEPAHMKDFPEEKFRRADPLVALIRGPDVYVKHPGTRNSDTVWRARKQDSGHTASP